MAQTTVELRNLQKLSNFQLFDFEYQFDDPQFKAELEQAIIDHYFDYEIAYATPDLFKQKFQTRWKRIMSYYNRLYNTTLLEYNPLINSKMSEALDQLATTSNTEDSSVDTEGNNTNTVGSNTVNSDYPQQPIAGGEYAAGESQTDSTTTDNGTTNSTSNITGSGTVDTNYTKTIEGLTGTSYQELIQKERENLLRITTMVINEMKPCFMMVY